MIRTQSIVSVSDAAKTPGGGDVADGGASAGAAGDRPSSSSIRGMKETSSVRRRKFKSGSSSPGKGAQQKVSPSRAKAAPGKGGHESGSTIPEESDGGGVVTSSSRYRKDLIFLPPFILLLIRAKNTVLQKKKRKLLFIPTTLICFFCDSGFG